MYVKVATLHAHLLFRLAQMLKELREDYFLKAGTHCMTVKNTTSSHSIHVSIKKYIKPQYWIFSRIFQLLPLSVSHCFTWKQKSPIAQMTQSSLFTPEAGSTEVRSLTARQKKSKKPRRWLQIFTVSLDSMKILQRKWRNKDTCVNKACTTEFPNLQKRPTWLLPPQAEFGGQVSPVAICDEGVFSQEEGDLFVGVQPYPLGYQHRPVLVAAQLDEVGSLQQLLGHLQQHPYCPQQLLRQKPGR